MRYTEYQYQNTHPLADKAIEIPVSHMKAIVMKPLGGTDEDATDDKPNPQPDPIPTQPKLNILTYALSVYRRQKLIKSQQAFSMNVLGMQPSYFSCMVSRNCHPSLAVLLRLLCKTEEIMSTTLRNPKFRHPDAADMNASYDELAKLVGQLLLRISRMETEGIKEERPIQKQVGSFRNVKCENAYE